MGVGMYIEGWRVGSLPSGFRVSLGAPHKPRQ